MTIDSLQQVITINGTLYNINIKEFETFIKNCEQFIPVGNNGLETMTQIISDQLIDNANGDLTIEELRPQLKFLREVGFLLKGLFTPVEHIGQD